MPSPLTTQEVKRTSVSLWRSLLRKVRANFPLKLISLASAIVLYFYVQSERNPMIARTLVATISKINAPIDVEIETEPQQVLVNITGSRQIVERLKDGDVRAMLDLKGVIANDVRTVSLPLNATIPALSEEMRHEVVIELQTLRVKVTLYPPVTRTLSVHANYPKEPPAGFKYGQPEVRPGNVKISGRADFVNSVDHLVVNAAPNDTGAKIEGEFSILALDKKDNPVEGVTLNPARVRVYVQLVEDLPSKIIPISPEIPDQPLPPYSLSDITSTPQQVKIMGRPGRLEQISTLKTEVVSVRDMTQTQVLIVNLIIPPDITVRDASDKPVTTIKLRIEIQKTEPEPTPKATPTPARPPEKKNGG